MRSCTSPDPPASRPRAPRLVDELGETGESRLGGRLVMQDVSCLWRPYAGWDVCFRPVDKLGLNVHRAIERLRHGLVHGFAKRGMGMYRIQKLVRR